MMRLKGRDDLAAIGSRGVCPRHARKISMWRCWSREGPPRSRATPAAEEDEPGGLRGKLARSGEQRRRRERLERADLSELIGAATADCTDGSGIGGGGDLAFGDSSASGAASSDDTPNNLTRAPSMIALRDKLAVLAGQVRVEKERNARLEKDLAKSRKTSQSLRTRLRNIRPTVAKGKADSGPAGSAGKLAAGAEVGDRPRFLSP